MIASSYLVVLVLNQNSNIELSNEIISLFEGLGLKQKLIDNKNNEVILPKNMFCGVYKGENSQTICNDLALNINKIFSAKNIKYDYFLASGGNSWAWQRSEISNKE